LVGNAGYINTTGGGLDLSQTLTLTNKNTSLITQGAVSVESTISVADTLNVGVSGIKFNDGTVQKSAVVSTKSLSSTGAPTSIPEYIGQSYVNTSNGNIYIAVGTAGSYNWGFVGAGNIVNDYLINLTSWYDASDSLTPNTNGSTLTGWNDKGSRLNHLTNVANTPQYFDNIQNGLPAAYFDGVNESIYGANQGNTAQPQTMFLVCKPTGWSTGTYQVMVSTYYSSSAYMTIGKNNGNTAIWVSAGTDRSASSIMTDTSYIITVAFNGASSTIGVNANAEDTVSPGTNGNEGYPTIGAVAGTTYPYAGYVMEWRVYDGVLTDENQIIVRNFLNNKWGIY
jgi:hypothetical protein